MAGLQPGIPGRVCGAYVSELGLPAARVEPLGNGRFSVVLGESRRVAYAVVAGKTTWVWLDGKAFVVGSDEQEGRVARAQADDIALAAPMPATVRAISVSVGQTVSAGDVLVVLEAMKMELALKAPRDGTVIAVHCESGQIVQPGVPLVELE